MIAVQEISQSDTALLAAFALPESRQHAFQQLVQKYSQRLYWHIRKMVLVHEDADDLLQEVFVKAWKNLPKFRQDAQLYTWLYRIATNESLRFIERHKRKYATTGGEAAEWALQQLSAQASPSATEVELKLQQALLTLPEKQRLVFNLRYYDEMPYQQMAEVLETSVGALKASYHHAAKKIEAFLKDTTEDLP